MGLQILVGQVHEPDTTCDPGRTPRPQRTRWRWRRAPRRRHPSRGSDLGRRRERLCTGQSDGRAVFSSCVRGNHRSPHRSCVLHRHHRRSYGARDRVAGVPSLQRREAPLSGGRARLDRRRSGRDRRGRPRSRPVPFSGSPFLAVAGWLPLPVIFSPLLALPGAMLSRSTAASHPPTGCLGSSSSRSSWPRLWSLRSTGHMPPPASRSPCTPSPLSVCSSRSRTRRWRSCCWALRLPARSSAGRNLSFALGRGGRSLSSGCSCGSQAQAGPPAPSP